MTPSSGPVSRMYRHQHSRSGHHAGIDGIAQADVDEIAAAHVGALQTEERGAPS
jgi:hypothetical protein